MTKAIFRSLAAVIIVFLVMALRPVNTSENNREKVNGVVEDLWHIPSGDIVLMLEGNPTEYYINRGKQLGLSADNLSGALLNQEVEIEFADHWTPLDPRAVIDISQAFLPRENPFIRITLLGAPFVNSPSLCPYFNQFAK
jgi:hypothetical protein